MNEQSQLILSINNDWQLQLAGSISLKELKEKLVIEVNELINHNFEKLVSLLYRIDVDENRMRYLLRQQEGENAASLIADLIIERQLQKIRSRKNSTTKDDIPDDEKW